jgi:hypothetical protein
MPEEIQKLKEKYKDEWLAVKVLEEKKERL